MESQSRRDHWEQFYATHSEQKLSRFELVPLLSLEMIRKSAHGKSNSIVDIGGGNSRLSRADDAMRQWPEASPWRLQ